MSAGARHLADLYRRGEAMAVGNSLLLDLGGQGGVVFKRTGAGLDALEHVARYLPGPLSMADRLSLAGVVSSYGALVWKSAPVRDAVVARLREHHDRRDPDEAQREAYQLYQAAARAAEGEREAAAQAAARLALRRGAQRLVLAATARPAMHAATPAELAAHLFGVLVGASGDPRRVVDHWSSGAPAPPRFDDFESACRHALRVCDSLWPEAAESTAAR